MIPIKDDNPTHHFPFMTILLILGNITVYIYQMTQGPEFQAFIYRFGAIPWEITHFREVPNIPTHYSSTIPNILTPLTSIFLHGSVFHLLGNMLYLWIFGDNVEALVGHFRFFIFYICCGLIAALTQILIAPNSSIPMIGASGAISGVLGAYLLRFPRAKVHVLIFFFFFIRIVRVSALFVLGLWFFIQLFNGLGSIGLEETGGVAWFAHIGGFAAGMILVLLFEKKGPLRIRKSVLY
ncbi:rhomboid family intramembrane serine protease [bacterium]|nr:rhomboid family intramembrane serine protease [bacterium]RQV93279.1 MAG: rhomboid family intramembrane serine protease [bacterium]